MGWVALVRAVLALLEMVGRTLERRSFIKAAESQVAARVLQEAIDALEIAQRARRDSNRRNADPDELRRPDKYRRD